MSVAMRLPSRIGTITLRSMMATDSSSFSIALRFVISFSRSSGVRFWFRCAYGGDRNTAKDKQCGN